MTVLNYIERQIDKVRVEKRTFKSARELIKELNALTGLNVRERESEALKRLARV